MRLTITIALLAATALPACAAEDLIGAWKAASIAGLPSEHSASIEFLADGSASGNGGCNTFAALHGLDGPSIEIQNLMSTLTQCEASEEEHRFFEALARARSWTMDANGAALLDAEGTVVVTLVPSQD